MLYDPNDAKGIYCMRRSEQESLNDTESVYVDTRRNVDNAAYYYFELYALETTEVHEEFQRDKLHNRMMQVLTGDQSYSRETMALGGTLTQARRREDAERRGQQKGKSKKRG